MVLLETSVVPRHTLILAWEWSHNISPACAHTYKFLHSMITTCDVLVKLTVYSATSLSIRVLEKQHIVEDLEHILVTTNHGQLSIYS